MSAEEAHPSARGLAVARDYARWHIGYAEWADNIIRAYLHPDKVAAELQAEMDEKVPSIKK